MPKNQVNILVESLSKRLCRTEGILLIIGRKERDIDVIGEMVERMKTLLRIPVGVIFSTGIPNKDDSKYSEILDSYDLSIGIGVREAELKAAVLLLDFRDAGAYTILIDREKNELRSGVNMQIKAKFPGIFDFILRQAGGIKSGETFK